VQFDFALVTIGIFTSYLLTPILLAFESDANFGPLMVLRVFRLLRLARALRLLVRFRTLWMLVQGLLSSAGTMLYTFGLMALIIYIFACMGVELITKAEWRKEDPEFDAIVEASFPNMGGTMLTLMQLVTLDSAASVYRPIAMNYPSLLLYFIAFILMVSISLMNLVTAVLVNGAIEQAASDKDTQRAYKSAQMKTLMPQMQEMFMALDDDKSGSITLAELQEAPPKVHHQLFEFLGVDDHVNNREQNMQHIIDIFECIDLDDSGIIKHQEFLDGLARLALSDTPQEMLRVLRQLQVIRAEAEKRDKALNQRLDGLGAPESDIRVTSSSERRGVRAPEEEKPRTTTEQDAADKKLHAKLDALMNKVDKLEAKIDKLEADCQKPAKQGDGDGEIEDDWG